MLLVESLSVRYVLGAPPAEVKVAIFTNVLLTVGIGVSCSTLVFLLRHKLGFLYTTDARLVSELASVLNVFAVFVISDGLNCVFSGIVRGAGRQELGGIVNITAYYIVGLPTAWVLAFHRGFGLMGIWYGLAIANLLACCMMGMVVLRMDWEIEATNAANRVTSSEVGVGVHDGESQPLLPSVLPGAARRSPKR
jgi:MATE family multidrug resistance protein